MNTSKMYIAVLDEAPDYMVPTLVAHSVINAHLRFTDDYPHTYNQWLDKSFRKVTLRVNRKEYDKIKETLVHWEGHENTICDGKGSCLVVLPLDPILLQVPNVLKFAKLWAPKEVL